MSEERQDVPACPRTFSWVSQPDVLRPNQINMKLLFAPCIEAKCAGFRVENGIPFCGLAGPVDQKSLAPVIPLRATD